MNNRLWLDYSKVRSALDFGTVLSHSNIEYPVGRNQIKILCPFHPEKTPSLSINVADGKWQCFGCGAKGNTLEFLVRLEGGDPDDKDDLYRGAELALSLLGQNPEHFTKSGTKGKGSKRPAEAAKDKKRPESRPTPQSPVLSDSEASGEAPAPQTNRVLDLELSLDPSHRFLVDRGITADVAERFGLGYCSRGIMKDRIAIPIHNERGELVAYAGRWHEEEVPAGIERYRLPKHFYKSHVLFNLHRAQALGRRHLVLVEGFWSVIRLHEAGIAAASVLGHDCSTRQAELIRAAGFKFVTLLFDGDAAGRAGMATSLPILASQVYVRTIELPEGMKPDTMPESYFDRLR